MTRFSDTAAKIHFYFKGANGLATEISGIAKVLIMSGIISRFPH